MTIMSDHIRTAPVSRGTWKPFNWLGRYYRAQQRAAADLAQLSMADDRQLTDIGLSRSDVNGGWRPGTRDAQTGLELLALRK